MCFPPRCYYCHRVVWWPFGLRIFRGTTGLHVAHRACFARSHRLFIFAGNRFRKPRR
jgi:hypothetical protein